jgi:hypothetical protein
VASPANFIQTLQIHCFQIGSNSFANSNRINSFTHLNVP